VSAKERAERRIAELSTRGLDVVSFWRACTEALEPAVPHYLGPCWYTLDPATLLVTSHFQEGIPEIPHEWLAQEYYEDDVNKIADVARSEWAVATLHDATGGDPTRSPRYLRDMVPYGGDQELIAALRTPSGEAWGCVGLYREPDRPLFDAEDQAFMRTVASHLAEGARRALLIGEAVDPDLPDPPGLVVLDADWSVVSMTPGTGEWLDQLPDGDLRAGTLPAAVRSVAGRAARIHEGGAAPGEVAMARVLSRSGRWIVLHGVVLASDGPARVAVIVEPAHPARIIPLLMAAFQLSEREQDVTHLVLQGCSTSEIADRLFISAHTVQQHLKAIFEKTGVRSRRDLVGSVFFGHYEPRVRDNERRATAGNPLRGGPLPAARPTSVGPA